MRTTEPCGAVDPPPGSWSQTVPTWQPGKLFTNTSWLSTWKPAVDSWSLACCSGRPTTSGTCACGGPVDTTSSTFDPGGSCVPAGGFVLMTRPCGTDCDGWKSRLDESPAA